MVIFLDFNVEVQSNFNVDVQSRSQFCSSAAMSGPSYASGHRQPALWPDLFVCACSYFYAMTLFSSIAGIVTATVLLDARWEVVPCTVVARGVAGEYHWRGYHGPNDIAHHCAMSQQPCLPPWVEKITSENTTAWKRAERACGSASNNLLADAGTMKRRVETPSVRALVEAGENPGLSRVAAA